MTEHTVNILFVVSVLIFIGSCALIRMWYLVGRGKGWESGHEAGYKMGFEHGTENGKSEASEDYRQKLYALMLQSANAGRQQAAKTPVESANV